MQMQKNAFFLQCLHLVQVGLGDIKQEVNDERHRRREVSSMVSGWDRSKNLDVLQCGAPKIAFSWCQ